MLATSKLFPHQSCETTINNSFRHPNLYHVKFYYVLVFVTNYVRLGKAVPIMHLIFVYKNWHSQSNFITKKSVKSDQM